MNTNRTATITETYADGTSKTVTIDESNGYNSANDNPWACWWYAGYLLVFVGGCYYLDGTYKETGGGTRYEYYPSTSAYTHTFTFIVKP